MDMYSAFGRMQKTCRVLNVLLWIAVILVALGSVLMFVAMGFVNSANPFVQSVLAERLSVLVQDGAALQVTEDMVNVLIWVFLGSALYGVVMLFILVKLLLVVRSVLRGSSPFAYQQVCRFRHMAIGSLVGFVLLSIVSTISSTMLAGKFALQISDGWIMTVLILFTVSALFTYGVEKQMAPENDAPRLD